MNYRKLTVWNRSMDLVVEMYRLSTALPEHEQFGLLQQIRRSAVSIPSNIAEGSRKDTDKDFRKYLTIAFASGAELETQIEIMRRLKYVSDHELLRASLLLDQVMRMLNTLRATLRDAT